MSSSHRWPWFNESRLGLFIHWGPYALFGRGEQVLMREMRDHAQYARQACAWNPRHFDARQWARTAREAGFRYAVLTTRHHDGYCLWDTRGTDYSSAAQAPGRDFVREFTDAFRAEGLRVGLYYSLGDWRIPAFFLGPDRDPAGWNAFRDYCHAQVRELLTGYGRIDLMWFDGAWPRDAAQWRSRELVAMMRQLQPDILINNRLGHAPADPQRTSADGGMGAGESVSLGDYGTPEHSITPDNHRPWESCQVTTWRLWGHTPGERWRPADLLLDMLCECAQKGGNLLLNVGPDAEGQLPAQFITRAHQLGPWLAQHGSAIYNTQPSESFIESVTFGRVTRTGDRFHLILRFYPHDGSLFLPGLATPIRKATLITTGETLAAEPYAHGQVLRGLPPHSPTELFPVITLELDGEPRRLPWYEPGQWLGDATRYVEWAQQRGPSVWADGNPRPADS